MAEPRYRRPWGPPGHARASWRPATLAGMRRWGPAGSPGPSPWSLLGAGLALVPRPAERRHLHEPLRLGVRPGLAERYPGIKVTAAVYDTRTGCWHHLHKGLQLTTASVIKAQVLGAVLLKAQDAGRGLTAGSARRSAR